MSEQRAEYQVSNMIVSLEVLMTQARDWPYQAAEARDQAAEHIQYSLNQLRPILKKMMTAEELSRLALAMDALNTALRLLESQGAKTKP